MNSLDEVLVRKVFEEMVKARPSLAKYVAGGHDELEAGEDIRVLADHVIRGFPWPIGVELRRLFSGTHRDLDRGRLDQMFRTIERTMQFLSFILTSQLLEEAVGRRIDVPLEFRAEFRKRFPMLGMGNFAWLVRTVGVLFTEQQVTLFASELKDVLGKPFYQLLDSCVPERNDIAHYLIHLTEEEIEKRCVEYGEQLTGILEKLAFFVAYRLVTVREIRVIKRKRQEPYFDHSLDILNSSHSDFETREVSQQEAFSDSQSVLLIKDLRKPGEFLNLSPLVIDTRAEVHDAAAKFKIRKDIFLFSKFVNGKPAYVGTEATEKVDLSLISSYRALKGEVEEFLDVLGSEDVA